VASFAGGVAEAAAAAAWAYDPDEEFGDFPGIVAGGTNFWIILLTASTSERINLNSFDSVTVGSRTGGRLPSRIQGTKEYPPTGNNRWIWVISVRPSDSRRHRCSRAFRSATTSLAAVATSESPCR
jgi:hypothetical protein